MSELGQLLIKARLERGLSLDELQESTKIRKTYLEAIEEGNYKKLPGNFYVRAFIKSYAEAVGLEPEEVLSHYKNVIPPTNYDQNIEPVKRKRTGASKSEKLSKIAFSVLMWTFLLLIVGIIYYYLDSRDAGNKDLEERTPITDKLESEANEVNKTPIVDEVSDKPIEPEVTPTPQPTPMVTFIRTEGTTDVYEVSNSSQLEVQFKLTGDACWFEVIKDSKSGERVAMNTLDKNNPMFEWEFDHPVYINVGRGNSIEIIINGEIIETGTEPDPKRMQVGFSPS